MSTTPLPPAPSENALLRTAYGAIHPAEELRPSLVLRKAASALLHEILQRQIRIMERGQ